MTPAVSDVFAVAARGPWGRAVFNERLAARPGTWKLFTEPDQLTPDQLRGLRPRHLFVSALVVDRSFVRSCATTSASGSI